MPILMNRYQENAILTAIYPGLGTIQGLIYVTLKLNGEAGEVAEDVGKAIRDDRAKITEDRRLKLAKELGDVLWYVAAVSKELGFDLEQIALMNLTKLAERREKGTLQGSGSDR